MKSFIQISMLSSIALYGTGPISKHYKFFQNHIYGYSASYPSHFKRSNIGPPMITSHGVSLSTPIATFNLMAFFDGIQSTSLDLCKRYYKTTDDRIRPLGQFKIAHHWADLFLIEDDTQFVLICLCERTTQHGNHILYLFDVTSDRKTFAAVMPVYFKLLETIRFFEPTE